MTDAITNLVGGLRLELPTVVWQSRSSMLREIEDGLRDAQTVYLLEGHSPVQAARLAVEEFGDVDAVAVELRTELAARLVRSLGATQAVVLVLSVVSWAAVGSTSSDPGAPSAAVQWVHALFLVVALPAVVVGLAAHRRLRQAAESRDIRRWGRKTAATALAALMLTHATSMLKARISSNPLGAGDIVLAALSDMVGLALIAAATYVLLVMRRLGATEEARLPRCPA